MQGTLKLRAIGVPLANLLPNRKVVAKHFAGLPVAVCAMGVCWSPDVLLGLSWFTEQDTTCQITQGSQPRGILEFVCVRSSGSNH